MAKLSEAEKERRKHERKADRMNAAEANAYGPLFAHLAPVWTPEDAYRLWRLRKAGVAEQDGLTFRNSFEWIVVHSIERFALAAIGEAAREIASCLRRMFDGKPDYIRSSWREAMTGRGKVIMRYRLEFDPTLVSKYNADGRRVVADEWPGEEFVPLLCEADFDARFPRAFAFDPPAEHPGAEETYQQLAQLLEASHASDH